MSAPRPGVRIVLQIVWRVRADGDPLTPAAIERLGPYLTRYGQTMDVLVHAVGGVGDHLHVAADVPPTMTLREIQRELQRASGKFLRDTLGLSRFAWEDGAEYVCSIRPGDVETVSEYVHEQEGRHARGELISCLEGEAAPESADEGPPEWLRDVLRPD